MKVPLVTDLERASALDVVRAVQHLAGLVVDLDAVPGADEDLEDGHGEDAEENVLHDEAEQDLLDEVADAVAVEHN